MAESQSGNVRTVSYSFNRPNDTNNYADNDLLANSTTAGSVVPLSFYVGTGGFEIAGATLQKSGTAVTGATFELHLFNTQPTTTAGDNAAYTLAASPVSGFLGTIAFPAMTAFADDAQAVVYVGDQTGGINPIIGRTSDGFIYGLIQCAGNYTDEAANETFTATLILR